MIKEIMKIVANKHGYKTWKKLMSDTNDDYQIDCIEEVAQCYYEQNCTKHSVSGKRPTEFTIEEVIESIKTLWIKDFGRLDSNSPDRDGYFVCGFVREALKAACASGAVDKTVSDGFSCSECNGIDGHRKDCPEFIR